MLLFYPPRLTPSSVIDITSTPAFGQVKTEQSSFRSATSCRTGASPTSVARRLSFVEEQSPGANLAGRMFASGFGAETDLMFVGKSIAGRKGKLLWILKSVWMR